MYSLLWRNKFLTIDAKTIDDMIERLEESVTELKEMRDAGVTLGEGAEDDYAHLVTDDAGVAEKFGMEEEFFESDEEFMDEFSDDDDDEEN